MNTDAKTVITLEMLCAKGACSEGMAWVKANLPDGAEYGAFVKALEAAGHKRLGGLAYQSVWRTSAGGTMAHSRDSGRDGPEERQGRWRSFIQRQLREDRLQRQLRADRLQRLLRADRLQRQLREDRLQRLLRADRLQRLLRADRLQ